MPVNVRMYSEDMDLATRMRSLREQAGLTKTSLAKPRYTVSFVSQIEAGRRRPSPEALEFFAERLGVSPRYLGTGIPEGAEDELRFRLEQARQALRRGEVSEAEREARTVLDEASSLGLQRVRGEALLLRADALMSRGELRDAIDGYEEALEHPLAQRLAGLAVSGLARAYRSIGDLRYSVELVERFLNDREEPLQPGVSAELHSVLISLYFERGDIERARRAADRALVAAEQGISMEIRANAYWDASRVLAESKRWDEALELATRARLLMEEMEDRRSAARLYNAAAFICLESEPPRLDEARSHLDRAEAELREVGTAIDVAYVLTERARLAFLTGDADTAIQLVDEALERVGEDELERARLLFLKGRALGLRAVSNEAMAVLRDAAQTFRKHGARQQEAGCWREIGELHAARGEADAAVAALRAGLDALEPSRSRA